MKYLQLIGTYLVALACVLRSRFIHNDWPKLLDFFTLQWSLHANSLVSHWHIHLLIWYLPCSPSITWFRWSHRTRPYVTLGHDFWSSHPIGPWIAGRLRRRLQRFPEQRERKRETASGPSGVSKSRGKERGGKWGRWNACFIQYELPFPIKIQKKKRDLRTKNTIKKEFIPLHAVEKLICKFETRLYLLLLCRRLVERFVSRRIAFRSCRFPFFDLFDHLISW